MYKDIYLTIIHYYFRSTYRKCMNDDLQNPFPFILITQVYECKHFRTPNMLMSELSLMDI